MKPRSEADALVIGGGVAGLTAALWLHRAGLEVTVVDAGTPGGESTWAGGGIVCPVPPWAYPDAVESLVRRSRELFPALCTELAEETGIDSEYRVCGLVLTADPGRAGEAWLAHGHTPFQRGRLGDFEPALARPDTPALLLPEVAQVRNPRLARALVAHLAAHGVEVLAHRPVAALDLERGRCIGATLSDGTAFRADRTVLAAGAWTDSLLEASGLPTLGIAPVRGQMLLFRIDPGTPRHVVNLADGYLIPRADGHVLAGSTVERAGFDARPTREALHRLMAMAQAHCPRLTPDRLVAQWAGLRPGIRDDRPAIGRHAAADGLWLQAGGYRNGLGMAPAAAERLTEMITNRAQTCE